MFPWFFIFLEVLCCCLCIWRSYLFQSLHSPGKIHLWILSLHHHLCISRVNLICYPYILLYFFFKLINLFIFGCVGSSFLCEGFLQPRRAGATLHRGARASHYRGLSCCGAQAPDAQAQYLWFTGPVAPRHVGSSQTRARTRVPCTGRQTLNHYATREALYFIYYKLLRVFAVICMRIWSSSSLFCNICVWFWYQDDKMISVCPPLFHERVCMWLILILP